LTNDTQIYEKEEMHIPLISSSLSKRKREAKLLSKTIIEVNDGIKEEPD